MRISRACTCAASLATAALFFTACDHEPTTIFACTADARPGIVVSIVDSASSQVIRNTNVRGIAALEFPARTAYADTTMSVAADNTTFFPLWLAYEHAGIFTVSVDAPGYKPWSKEHVLVAKDAYGCHVVTVQLEAKLQPIG